MSYYDTAYRDTDAAMRREIYGRDIGQQSWLTAEQQRSFGHLAVWTDDTRLLDVACGAGGPALFLEETFGVAVTGIDSNRTAIAAAQQAAASRSARAVFAFADAAAKLPFADAGFDAVQCIDAINHLPGRAAVLAEWHRVLAPGGKALYTDPVVVTGQVTAEEFALRSSIGPFTFVPPGENERLLRAAGFEIVTVEDVTDSEAAISARRIKAREARRDALVAAEGEAGFDRTQKFLAAVHALSQSRRLTRFVYLARKA